MRIIFMGTPDFAVGTLEALVEAGHDVCLAVTQPDKPKGRARRCSRPGEGCCTAPWDPGLSAEEDPRSGVCGGTEKINADVDGSHCLRADPAEDDPWR